MKKLAFVTLVALLLVVLATQPAAAEGGGVAKQKVLVLDDPYGLIESWRSLEYTRERFGLGRFSLTLPLDHTMSDALAQYNRILIAKGDDDWDNQEARLWGVILDVQKAYAPDAGPELGGVRGDPPFLEKEDSGFVLDEEGEEIELETPGPGAGAAYITATGVTLTDYFLSGRAYPLPDVVELNPDGDGEWYGYWSGTAGDYTDIDEGVDNHDGDTTYLVGEEKGQIHSVTLDDYTDQGTVISGIRLRSVWKIPEAGVMTPHVFLRVPGHNEVLCSPDGAGTDSDWSGSYTDVDDNPSSPDGDTTYISSSTVGHKISFTIPEPGVARNAIFPKIRIAWRARRTTADAIQVKPYMIIGGTRYYSTTEYLYQTYHTHYGPKLLNPATDETWETSDLDDIEIGVEVVSVAGGEARVTMMYLEAPYVFQYELDQVEDSYAERYVDIVTNPGTLVAWTKSDLDGLEVGARMTETRLARLTAMGMTVYHKLIQTTGTLDDVLKAWTNANLGTGASASRQVTGFTEEADESAGPSDTWEIGYNVLLQRFLELAKENDTGFRVVGNWNGGATRLDASPSYEFQTSSPEGADRTHSQDTNDAIVLYRGRGTARGLDYKLGAVSARSVAYALGEKDGLELIKQEVAGDGLALAKEDGGLLLKEDGWPLLAENARGFHRRECVLDVSGADTTTQLTAQGEKFLGDEAAELETMKVELVSGQTMYEPLTDFAPGDFLTFYDSIFEVGPLASRVETITCRIPAGGPEEYEVRLGTIKRPALAEDAAFRATAKRSTLYTKGT